MMTKREVGFLGREDMLRVVCLQCGVGLGHVGDSGVALQHTPQGMLFMHYCKPRHGFVCELLTDDPSASD